MIKLGKTALNSPPRLAVVIADKENNEAIGSLRVDVLEVRVDLFENMDIDYIKANISKRSKTGIPLILTIRNDPSEGGKGDISDEKKSEIFRAVISSVDAVDIELKSPIVSEVVDLAKKNQKVVIVSSHNFVETPDESVLENIFNEAVEKGADIVKMAAKAKTIDDVNALMSFTLKHKEDNIITMSLGSVGSISRLTFPAAGSLLTYSYVNKPSAPGQIPLNALQKDLRRYYPKYNGYLTEKYSQIEDV
ncbi:MAG: type I 3-dehydroquinate dehydratase [Candidatus Omnitrophica bacterium]|nr:type I 3-dehydroquinate dehydratase [Candidatus Omnitrophota bacterium]